jgi:hypothetical protein
MGAIIEKFPGLLMGRNTAIQWGDVPPFFFLHTFEILLGKSRQTAPDFPVPKA